jgi:hypothetical protein
VASLVAVPSTESTTTSSRASTTASASSPTESARPPMSDASVPRSVMWVSWVGSGLRPKASTLARSWPTTGATSSTLSVSAALNVPIARSSCRILVRSSSERVMSPSVPSSWASSPKLSTIARPSSSASASGWSATSCSAP